MRKFFVSSLFLSAALVSAQQAPKGAEPTLIASNDAVSVAAPASDVPAYSPARRVSTGVVAPTLLYSPEVHVAAADFAGGEVASQKAVVTFWVNEKGRTEEVHVQKSVNPDVDARVAAAVRAYRYKPATLNDQAIAIPVTLNVSFAAPKN